MILDREFFAAAAQLIPLLVVAAAVDTQAWASSERARPSDVSTELIALVSVSTAWAVAMFVVGTGEPSALAGSIVALGLAVGWVQIVGSIAAHQLKRLGHARATRRQRMWLLALMGMPLGAVIPLVLSSL